MFLDCINCYKMKNNPDIELIDPCNENCKFCFLNYADVLGKNSLFRNLTHKEIGNIIKNVHHQVKVFNKGEMLAANGEELTRLIIIVRGAVVSEISDFEGKTICLDELKAPDTIASAFIFGDNNSLPVSVTATEETKVLIIHRDDLLILFRKNEVLMLNYLNIMANRAQHLSMKIKLLGLQTIKGKIAHYLLELIQDYNSNEIILPKSQTELSGLFGVARPSIGRAIREMDAKGIINAKGKHIKIIDKTALSGLLK